MQDKNRRYFSPILLLLSLFVLSLGTELLAQESGSPPRLFISGSKVASPPMIDLYVYGLDAQGNALDLSQESLAVTHNGVPMTPVTISGSHKAGTFTIFLIDIPPGVAAQLSAVQEAIKQFASEPTMEESVDAIAVYKVGETAAAQLLAPDTFHNSVRNLFATPLEPELGATALVDSLGGLIEQVDSLKPNPDMAAAIVVLTDGTDVVSTNYSENDIGPMAASRGIPIHTIWLTNENLSAPSQQFGQDYLADVAAGSRGLTARLPDTADLNAIWNRIAAFREQTVISYPVEGLAGGEYPVELSLGGSLVSRAETSVNVPGNLPMIAINLPPESQVLSLPDLDDPVNLRFPTSLSWLDGEERSLAAAQLIVNGTTYDIPVEDIAQFEVDLTNLAFGENSVRLAVLDVQGLRVTSPDLEITVDEGPKTIPPEMESGSSFWGVIGRIFLLLLALFGLGVVLLFAWRQGWLTGLSTAVPRGPSRPRRPVVTTSESPAAAASPAYQEQYRPTHPVARLSVLESVTRAQGEFSLVKPVVRIGRSPAQSDVAFENDITVSRLHASLHLEGNHYRIFDERSTSGTWVNDQQVPEYGLQLMDGDEIHLGAVHLRYRQP